MLTPTDAALALAFFLVAALYASVGHAGASGYTAVMAFAGLAPATMKPVALALNLVVAGPGCWNFVRAGHFRWRLFWPFAITAVPMSLLLGPVELSEAIYKPLIGAVLLFAALRLWQGVLGAKAVLHEPPLPAAMLAGVALGALAGVTGTGGGIFLSPLLLAMGWADVKGAAGTSIAFILANSLAGMSGRLLKGGLELPPALPWWAAAVLIGGGLGSYFGSRRFDRPALRRLLAVVLLVAGIDLIGQGVRAIWPSGQVAKVRSQP